MKDEEEKVVELNAHDPSPESVCSRLDRFSGEMTNITAIVEWKDGKIEVYGNTKNVGDYCLATMLLMKRFFDAVEDK